MASMIYAFTCERPMAWGRQMKLHDRVVRAGFFNHARFVMSFSRDERMFYEGLFLLADDSHCLLDDVYEFKAHIFPLDADIGPDILARWRDKLVAGGRAVKYRARGKDCLFLANAEEHASQKDAERPEVPLPSWVEWRPYPKNKYRGSYTFGEPVEGEGLSEGGLGLSDPTLRSKNQDGDVDGDVDGDLGGGVGEPPAAPPVPAAADAAPPPTSVSAPPPGTGPTEPADATKPVAASAVLHQVEQVVQACAKCDDTAPAYHDALAQELWRLGWKCEREHPVPDRGDGQQGYVDLYATRPGYSDLAMEIDLKGPRDKSIFKLRTLEAIRVVALRRPWPDGAELPDGIHGIFGVDLRTPNQDPAERDGKQSGQAVPADAGYPPDPRDPLLRALDRLRSLSAYVAKANDLGWLQQMATDYPDIDLYDEIGKCADRWEPMDQRPNAKRAVWRSRLHNWFSVAEQRASLRPRSMASPRSPEYRDLTSEPEPAAIWEARR